MPSDPSSTAVAVVVCAYTPLRLPLLLAAATEARRQADAPGDEVVVVVDHHDALLAAVSAAVPPGVAVVPSTGPRGLSGARNTGAAATSAPTLVYLDDDAVPRPGWLPALRERLRDPSVLVVGGAVHPRGGGGAAPRWFPEEYGWVVGCDYRGVAGDGQPIRNPIGACMAVRRPALEAAGGFSTELGRVGTLPAGCEETLMGIRVRQSAPAGVLLRDEGFAVDHLVPHARQRVRYLLRRCFHEGRSKAVVARAAGAGAGLSTEAEYVARSLTTAVVRHLAATARGDAAGLARAVLVVAGLVVTVAGLLSAGRPRRGRPGGHAGAPDPAAPTTDDAPVRPDELVTVVVATLGRHPRLEECVASVLAQHHRALDVVVVDNDPASAGEAARRLAHVDDPRLRVLAQPRRGASAARNTGLAAARGRVVAFTDDDAVVDPAWVGEVLAVLADDPRGEVTAVTGRVLAAETSTDAQRWFESAGIFDKGAESAVWALRPGRGLTRFGPLGERSAFFPYTAGEMGSGNNMAFRTDRVRALGGFDEALGPGLPSRGGEDLDLLRRVVLAGGVVVYRAGAVVRHHHRSSPEELREQMFGYGVGMSAVLTKIVTGGGRQAAAVLARVPRGAWTLLAPSSPKNVDRPAAMPRSLVHVELAGYLVGPWCYARSLPGARRRYDGPA